MDRRDVLKRLLYPKCKSAIEFKFDTLIANPMLTYITVQDIAQLNKIATSIRYSSKPKEKYKMIDNILVPRGFKKMASGTNRVVYRYLNDYRVVLKVAIDKVGLSDNGNEYKNQQLLKPFVSKCFEVSPCGTVGLFERVVPITSREEFINLSDSIFDLINNIIGKYVLEDIGEKYYMNYGLREGFGPVLLDYPYVFELDGRKLICNVQDPLDPKGYCGGEIDYDVGYDNLICTKCGKRYLATELKKPDETTGKPKIIIEGDDTIMKCVLKRGDEVVNKLNSEEPISTNTIPPRKQYDRMKGYVKKNNNYRGKNNNGNGYHKPNINKKDDVHLQARLKGRPKGKDIDKEARKAEEKAYEGVKSVEVSFEPEKKPETVTEKVTVDLAAPGTKLVYDDSASIVDDKSTKVIIDEDGAIFDDKDNLIGYTLKSNFIQDLIALKEKETEPDSNTTETKESDSETDIDKEEYESDKETNEELSETISDDESEDTDEHTDSENEDDSKDHLSVSIGDMIGDKFKGNDNYKTKNVVSPIAGHYSNNGLKEEEKEEIPELVIHPRRTIDSEEKKEIKNEY